MAYVDWMIKTKQLATCSCDYGYPSELNAPPTKTPCEGVMAVDIVEGYFGDVRLDGLRVAGVYRWPGPLHQGGGTWWSIIDKRATPEQIEALFKILSGEEQEPSTGFNIYASTIENEPDPIFAEIEFEWDIEQTTGRFLVPGVLEASLEPIKNPVTNAPHQAVIRLQQGFEFREAKMASSTFWSHGEIDQAHSYCYGYVTYVSYGPYGIIEEHSYPNNS